MERFNEPEMEEEPNYTPIAIDRKQQLHHLYDDLEEELNNA